MSKYTSLLIKTIFLTAFLLLGNKVLAEKEIKQENEGKDWIEELKEEIKAIEQENEGKDWIEELKEEIREVDQERNLKDEIEAEDSRKNKGSPPFARISLTHIATRSIPR